MSEPEPIQVASYREKRIPTSEPLETLVARMRKPSPPAIDMLVKMFRPPQGIKEFRALIQEYLPDQEQDILAASSVAEQMEAFCVDFSDLYFPLYSEWLLDDDGDGYDGLVNRCPAEFNALSSYNYDEIPENGDEATIVISFILENPWGGDRAALAEAALRHVPERILRHIPEEGFLLNGLDESLAGTRFESVAFWGKVISQSTGNHFFDAGDLEDTGAEFLVGWDRPTIDELTRQYQESLAWWDTWAKFKSWFTEDLVRNTVELIKILNERSKKDGGESAGEESYPELDPRQGRLLDVKPDGNTVASPSEAQDTAGPA